MLHLKPMDASRQQTLRELREQIQRGEYAVDSVAVADAIAEHIRGLDLAPKAAGVLSSPARELRRARLGRAPRPAHLAAA